MGRRHHHKHRVHIHRNHGRNHAPRFFPEQSSESLESNSHHPEYGDTALIEEPNKVLGVLTGKSDVVTIRNRYQPALDDANINLKKSIFYLEEENKKLKEAFNHAQSLKKDIDSHQEERVNAYEALGNLLNKEKDFEGFMHKETTKMYGEVSKNQSGKAVKIKQRLNNSDNEMRFGGMMKYIEKYPEYQTKSAFKRILEKIEEKEKEVRYAKTNYSQIVAQYHTLLQNFKIDIQKAKDKIKEYYKLLEEGQKKIDETRYKKGFVYKFTSQKTKDEVNLDTIKHRMNEKENTLKLIEEEISQYQGRKFIELEY